MRMFNCLVISFWSAADWGLGGCLFLETRHLGSWTTKSKGGIEARWAESVFEKISQYRVVLSTPEVQEYPIC